MKKGPSAVWIIILGVTLGAVLEAAPPDPPTATDLLEKAMRYHDPEGAWDRKALRLELDELRPDQTRNRRTIIEVEPARQMVSIERTVQEATTLVRSVESACHMERSGPGSEPATAEQISAACEGFSRLRNYYLYLWGLPMKLGDPGTRFGAVEDVGTSWRLKVTYDPDVGSDIWYFEFDKSTGAMVGYSFFFDTDEVSGERIELEGEVSGAGLRVPKSRRWIELPVEKNLGTDVLRSVTLLER